LSKSDSSALSSATLKKGRPGLTLPTTRAMLLSLLLVSARYGIFIFFGLFYAIVTVFQPSFLSLGNIYDILIETSLVSFVSFGQAIVIAGGGVDLSVGNIAGYGAMMTCYLLNEKGFGVASSMAIGIAVGGLIGLGNGLLVSRLYINSFIATLGTMFVLIAMLYMLTFGQAFLMLPDSFTRLGSGSLFNIPLPIWAMTLVFVLFHIFMEKTKHGRSIHMTGGNIEASRLSGVGIKDLTLLAFILCGLLSTLSGIMLAARQGVGNVDLGERFLLQSFTAALLGYVILGGRNILLGTLFGSIFLMGLINGMTILGAGPQWIYFSQGCLLLGAILLNYFSGRIVSKARGPRF